MFNSQYYTCEQVDERLLQGYVDDFNEVNSTNYSKEDLLLKLFQAINWDQVFGKYEENQEFVRVYLDTNNRVLWGILTNGDIYYGAGVPSQIKNYIGSKISELQLDRVEDILIFLDDLIDSDKTLKELLSGKVDKEEGKSLIDAGYASTKSNIENPEFLEVTTDSEDKVLEGMKSDGTKVISGDLNVGGSASIKGDAKILGNMDVSGVLYKVIENPEFVHVTTDRDGRIINSIGNDGEAVYGGINVSEIKRDLDVAAIGFRYEPETGNYYVKVNKDSTITIRYDAATGNFYQIKDSKVAANIEIRENGDMYIVQELNVKVQII